MDENTNLVTLEERRLILEELKESNKKYLETERLELDKQKLDFEIKKFENEKRSKIVDFFKWITDSLIKAAGIVAPAVVMAYMFRKETDEDNPQRVTSPTARNLQNQIRFR